MMQYTNCKRTTERLGATLLEVLFATIVIVVGLLGIATLIPYAARDAQTAANHSQAVSLGLGWADSFFARELHRPSPQAGEEGYGWRWYRDFTFGGSPPGWEDFVIGIPSFSSNSALGSPKSTRFWGSTPVCLDPYTMTSAPPASLFTTGGAYRASVFPYFDDGYDPSSDPLSPSGMVDQPRMLRATLGFGQPIGIPTVLGRKVVETIFGSMDGLIEDESIDPNLETLSPAFANIDSKNAPVRRLFTGTGTDPALAGTSAIKAQMDGRYTWMATVVPFEPGGTITESALVSFLILSRHDHTINVGAVPNKFGERVTRVTPLSGNFFGGAGGRVRLTCSAEVDDSLEIGSWIMLGRFIRTTVGGPYLPFFRWYRIIGLDAEAQFSGTVWNREVVLDGPDFAFEELMASPDSQMSTYGTLVGGVITVIERQVKLQ